MPWAPYRPTADMFGRPSVLTPAPPAPWQRALQHGAVAGPGAAPRRPFILRTPRSTPPQPTAALRSTDAPPQQPAAAGGGRVDDGGGGGGGVRGCSCTPTPRGAAVVVDGIATLPAAQIDLPARSPSPPRPGYDI
eukprot:scaffold1558_cov403-Prasinococcus_capsulatus_cf.AAC.36